MFFCLNYQISYVKPDTQPVNPEPLNPACRGVARQSEDGNPEPTPLHPHTNLTYIFTLTFTFLWIILATEGKIHESGPPRLLAEEIVTLKPKLSDFNRKVETLACSMGAGVKPTPTQQVNQRLVGAGFTPARTVVVAGNHSD
jgi:hypothetical protein